MVTFMPGSKFPLSKTEAECCWWWTRPTAGELTAELAQLEVDLNGDGWAVTRLDVSRTDSVVKVKSLIRAASTWRIRSTLIVSSSLATCRCLTPATLSLTATAPDHQGRMAL